MIERNIPLPSAECRELSAIRIQAAVRGWLVRALNARAVAAVALKAAEREMKAVQEAEQAAMLAKASANNNRPSPWVVLIDAETREPLLERRYWRN